ncbi:GTPase-activator protein for Ras-like GTPase [Maioricimonas rarisocia]|uniref:GTPase-activator protein for Ras-like GTPase n=1 Tax=Maioricimonas rarisocia TaxID=2528026 RepID=A0A517ZFG9_9PLAN|nr:hypothetical protein [Maioricimonas rarisocia]QDU41230.1 GTPase-activator protein for Ras-like GTPase [Maioricimonas rarisocia]
MNITEEEYIDMLAGYDSGGEGTSDLQVTARTRRRRGAMIVQPEELTEEIIEEISEEPDPKELAGTLLDFKSSINTKKLKVKAPLSKHTHHNQGYIEDVLEPISDVSMVLASISDKGTATFSQIKSLLSLNDKLAGKEEEYSGKKSGKILKKSKKGTQDKVDEIHGYREKVDELVASVGRGMVASLADKMPPTDEEDKKEALALIDFLATGSDQAVSSLIVGACPNPQRLAEILAVCPGQTLTPLAEKLIKVCVDMPDYVQVIIEESLHLSAPKESTQSYFRSGSVGMNLIMVQKKAGPISDYLETIGGDVQKLIANSSKRLEVDPSKRIEPPRREHLQPGTEEDAPVPTQTLEPEVEPDEHLDVVIATYQKLAQSVLKKLDVDAIPDPICRCARILYDGFVTKTQDKAGAREKVSSFLFIRYISPLFNADLITSPPGGKKLSPDQQRIGIVLGKVLQNIGNQKHFTSKEAFMKPFNSLVDEYADAIDGLATDVLKRAGVQDP